MDNPVLSWFGVDFLKNFKRLNKIKQMGFKYFYFYYFFNQIANKAFRFL
jgi:hypothetical protein